MQEEINMSLSVYHDQIKYAILDQMSENKPLHKKDVKSIIDNVKNQYLWTSKIRTDELSKIIAHFKAHWQDLKDHARNLRRQSDFAQFRRYQV
jgi:hypothetical protein